MTTALRELLRDEYEIQRELSRARPDYTLLIDSVVELLLGRPQERQDHIRLLGHLAETYLRRGVDDDLEIAVRRRLQAYLLARRIGHASGIIIPTGCRLAVAYTHVGDTTSAQRIMDELEADYGVGKGHHVQIAALEVARHEIALIIKHAQH